jgi:hypothetical protein
MNASLNYSAHCYNILRHCFYRLIPRIDTCHLASSIHVL